MTLHQVFISKNAKRQAVVGIVGLGYVGLPFILCFAERGFKSIGLDIDPVKTKAIMRGGSYIKHIPAEKIQKAVKSGSSLRLLTSLRRLAVEIANYFDLLLISTPHEDYKKMDFSKISIPILGTRHVLATGTPGVYQVLIGCQIQGTVPNGD